jgi:hypothetical protein
LTCVWDDTDHAIADLDEATSLEARKQRVERLTRDADQRREVGG